MHQTERIYSVAELNTAVRSLIRAEFPAYVWVTGEMQDVRVRQHINFNLVQKNPHADEFVAQAKAVIFENVKHQIYARLKDAEAQLTLADDMEVKLLCKVDLYVKTGAYSLTVFDIDPFFTLGNAAKNRLKIIEELTKEGLLEKNKSAVLPPVPLSLGLITAEGSAAYHDCIHELTKSGYAFSVQVYDCYMQGKATEGDVCAALQFFNTMPESALDAILIIRGGGSTADLSWFDSKAIARAIAGNTHAVITALGHQINTTVADLAAHTSVKTPTAAAQFFVQRVGLFEREIESLGTRACAAALQNITQAYSVLESGAVKADAAANRFFIHHREELAVQRADIVQAALRLLAHRQQECSQQSSLIEAAQKKIFKEAKDLMQHIEEKVMLLDPRVILRRGYSISYKGTMPVTSAQTMQPGDTVRTVLYSGSFFSQVHSVEQEDGHG